MPAWPARCSTDEATYLAGENRSRRANQQPNKHIPELLIMASLRPLDDRVVLKVLDAEEKTAGGILLPDSA